MSGIRQGKRSGQSGGAAAATASGYSGQVSSSGGAPEMVMAATRVRPAATGTKSTIASGVANAVQLPLTLSVSNSSTHPSSTKAATAPLQQQQQQQQTNGQSKQGPNQAAAAASTGNKLVFGLSSRTNKLRHDEYAEKRGATKRDLQQQQQQQQLNSIATANRIERRLETSKSLRAPVVIEQRGDDDYVAGENCETGVGGVVAVDSVGVGGHREDSRGEERKGSGVGKSTSIRASKYGNFYKPQDLVTKTTQATTTTTVDCTSFTSPARPSRSPQRELLVTNRSRSPARPISAQKQQQLSKQPDKQTSIAITRRAQSPTRKSFKQQVQGINSEPSSQFVVNLSKTTSFMKERDPNERAANSGAIVKAVAATNQDDALAMKTGSGISGSTTTTPSKPTISSSNNSNSNNNYKMELEMKGAQSLPKMQFNIPPPPQVSSSGGNNKPGGSAVSYAKSRIYDRPTMTKQQILLGESSSLLSDSGNIPESILSGFKPPKQVNVSKAREKWEGGEPFAKCKSRQRLASAQASNMKKLLHGFGYWSMNSSMVAMQQMQLQQAMTMSANGTQHHHQQQQLNNDSPVKILTRGSVLERVQQFEKSPNSASGSSGGTSPSSGGSSSGSESSSGSNSPAGEPSPNATGGNLFMAQMEPSLRPDGSASSPKGGQSPGPMDMAGEPYRPQATTEAGLALRQPMEPAELRSSSPAATQVPGNASQSKQAIYKNRVSSIQTQQPHTKDPLTMLATNGPKTCPSSSLGSPPAATATSPAGGMGGTGSGQRRPSLRRRSSSSSSLAGSTGSNPNSNSSSANIPKFYHPYGKPNTYEIELQKKNIVSCFDKFPDRKALISGPTCRRHFHAISLACGFSEYFKEPLCLYVKHQMTNSNLLHNLGGGGPSSIAAASASIRRHRQSGIGPGMINLNNIINNDNSSKQAATATATTTTPAQTNHQHQLTRAASIDNSTMERIHQQTFVTCEQFLICWRQMISEAFDNHARFVYLLTLGRRNHLIPEDFVPLIQSIIDDHPGLKFLRSAPDFHMRYIQTVIARIYYCINKSWTGKLSLAELRQSNLLAVLDILSHEEDINQITDYFSYEHFYVIYCKFWSLDKDHDLLISKEDLAKHNDAAISSRVIERIFMGIVSRQIQKTGMMSYSDFVWFLLAEEDKKHPRSIEYWFRLLDLDGDGYISMYEMEYFYYEQMKRLELMNIEALPFIDSACQILDLVNPKEKNKISLADLKRTKMATIFFDTFINLEKYLEHESREFVSTRDHVQDGVVISDWDRFASEEYESLVTEESSV